ncbi:MAG: hypothetical protein MZV70_02755 [Desulfobacterales bacterium]|nr:hypothetical protein [Desulfobacterales bacterium]
MQKLQGDPHFEPPEALDGGGGRAGLLQEDRRWAPSRLRENGMLLMEVGYGQAAEVETPSARGLR